MKVFSCLGEQHNPWLVLLAAMMCVVGSFVVVQLLRRTLNESGTSRYLWCFLSSVSAGSAIWATHFIAMLGYDPGVPVSFDGTLTILSALVAVVGTGIGIAIGTVRRRWVATIAGGTVFGLSIATMHYIGMSAYEPVGRVHWDMAYVAASIVMAVGFSIAAFDRLHRDPDARRDWIAVGLLVAAIVTLHFTGMAAFDVMPMAKVHSGMGSDAFSTLATAIAGVALLVAGTGLSTHLVDKRTRSISEDRLHYIAMHDALTDTANRRSFEEALIDACTALTDDAPIALLIVDLDGFKGVNDTRGHPVGDELLRRVAARLKEVVRTSDLVARIGGDEFAIIMRENASRTEVQRVAERVVEALVTPFVIEQEAVEIGGSVGVAIGPCHGRAAETLNFHADMALYSAKRAGKARVTMFDADLGRAVEERNRLETDLRRACMRGDFMVRYQPIVNAATGEVAAAEALVRWARDDGANVGPDVFIPLAEELGLVGLIGQFVLRTACRTAIDWPARVSVAVNLSPVQLVDADLVAMVAAILAETGLPASRLNLEITETALLADDDRTLRTLTGLRALGVSVSLDDFGTGYSSLSYLHKFPIDRIKIDRSFVQRLPGDADSLSIVRAITQLAIGLDIRVTAEGIENEAQREMVRLIGCDHLQGYLFGEPANTETMATAFDDRARALVAA